MIYVLANLILMPIGTTPDQFKLPQFQKPKNRSGNQEYPGPEVGNMKTPGRNIIDLRQE